MANNSCIVSTLHHLKIAKTYLEVFCIENKESKGAAIFNQYLKKIGWIKTDLITHPFFTQEVRDGINQEWDSDVLQVVEIHNRIALLPPEKREILEQFINKL